MTTADNPDNCTNPGLFRLNRLVDEQTNGGKNMLLSYMQQIQTRQQETGAYLIVACLQLLNIYKPTLHIENFHFYCLFRSKV